MTLDINLIFFKESMKTIGCTTPFGMELENICTDQNKSLEAYDLFKQILDYKKIVKERPYPCTFLMNQMTPVKVTFSQIIAL